MRIRVILATIAAFLILPVAAQATDKTLSTYDTPGSALDVAISGNYAYVADNDGIVILNISDSSAPTLAGNYVLSGAKRLDIVGTRLYVADGTALSILSLTDPTDPSLLGQFDTNDFSGFVVNDVRANATHAFVTGIQNSTQPVLAKISITDPTDLTFTSTWITGAADLDLEGGYVYVVSGRTMIILTTDLTTITTYTDPQSDSSYQQVDVEDNIAYISDIMNGFHTISVSNPSVPAGSYDSDPALRYGGGVAVLGDFVFLGQYFSGGLAVYSAPATGDPVYVDDYDGIIGVNGLRLAVSNGLAILTLGDDGLHFIDVSTPDEVAPVVTLNGKSTVELKPGATYSDPGADAIDNVDGDISSSVVRTGTLDKNKVGRYVRTYTATDAAGNHASVQRVIIVVPTQTTLTGKAGKYTISVHGKTKKIQPFPEYTDTILARKLIVNKKSEPYYLFIMTSATDSPKLALYNHSGKLTTTKSLGSISNTGLNVQVAADPASRKVFIGIAPKSGGLVATLYQVGKTGLSSAGTVRAKLGTGTLIFKFLRAYANQQALVTHISGKLTTPKVWRYSGSKHKFVRDTDYDAAANLVWTKTNVRLK